MAEKRMFSKAIVDSDAFLDMSAMSQLLYFHLGLRADDDGFINNAKSIMRMIGGSEDDLKMLVDKKFILAFPDGVVCLKHWKIHNNIRKDTYTETKYKEDLMLLELDENNSYRFRDDSVTGTVRSRNETVPQIRLDKNRLDKNNNEVPIRNIIPPTLDMVRTYCEERRNGIDAERFCNYYEARGWKLKTGKMRDWQAAVRTWEGNGVTEKKDTYIKTQYDFKELEKMIKEG